MNNLEQNTVSIFGKVISEPVLSHTAYGEDFYTFDLEVKRLSEAADIVPILISKKLMADIIVGNHVSINGQMRTYNKIENKSRKLMIYVFVVDVTAVEADKVDEYNANKDPNNIVKITGFLCKDPIYRTTPFGREITDLLVAVNRSYHKSDYIPCIAWGRNAKYAKTFKVGQQVEITARFQSREYRKKDESGNMITKCAYELSVLNVVAL